MEIYYVVVVGLKYDMMYMLDHYSIMKSFYKTLIESYFEKPASCVTASKILVESTRICYAYSVFRLWFGDKEE